jgi:hypothetical protein
MAYETLEQAAQRARESDDRIVQRVTLAGGLKFNDFEFEQQSQIRRIVSEGRLTYQSRGVATFVVTP